MAQIVLAVIFGIVSVVLPNYPDLAGDPVPVWMVFFLCLGIWQTLDGIKRLFQQRGSPRFEFRFAMVAFALVALVSFWPDDQMRPAWVVSFTAAMISCVIDFFKATIRDRSVKTR